MRHKKVDTSDQSSHPRCFVRTVPIERYPLTPRSGTPDSTYCPKTFSFSAASQHLSFTCTRPLTILSQEQPIALLQGNSMSCTVPIISIPHFSNLRRRKEIALLEYLSSGLNLAGCADFVTSPAWTWKKSTASAQRRRSGQDNANLVESVQSFPISI